MDFGTNHLKGMKSNLVYSLWMKLRDDNVCKYLSLRPLGRRNVGSEDTEIQNSNSWLQKLK